MHNAKYQKLTFVEKEINPFVQGRSGTLGTFDAHPNNGWHPEDQSAQFPGRQAQSGLYSIQCWEYVILHSISAQSRMSLLQCETHGKQI